MIVTAAPPRYQDQPHRWTPHTSTPCPRCGWQPNVDNPPPALARFDQHPGIVTVKSFFRAHGTGYCVMDSVEGLTLKHRALA
ncbi:hypothetical protein, partial [Thiocapsa imhoffii]|uniref:hypothetical protein n=1 Tax=Thiocapsa imhoffii TaxID=382777 RepID=UPI001A91A87C